MPDFQLEKAAGGLVCGVDEAGRGPLAGPVVAGAALLDRRRLPRALRDGLDDSKKLSRPRREALYALLTETDTLHVAVGIASVEEIDSLNILRATHLAMTRAVEALGMRPDLALIDGNQAPRTFPCPTRCVVKGDSLSLSIAAASIMAKVTRDRIMDDLARAFPVYGWERNAGYGTKEHRAAIAAHGPCAHHRKSFARQGELFADPKG